LQASCWTILHVCGPHTQPCFMLFTGRLLSASSAPLICTRWRTSCLNSGGTSPSTSQLCFNYRQPYLGWRSQERLTRPRSPVEQLAAGLLPIQQQQHQLASPQGIITPKQTQQQLLQQEAELEQLQQEDEEQVGYSCITYRVTC
jgi:hypothetical protein